MSAAVQGATLEALVAGHPAGKAAALLQQKAYKTKGQESMALRMRATFLEDQAAGMKSDSLQHPQYKHCMPFITRTVYTCMHYPVPCRHAHIMDHSDSCLASMI